MDKKSTPYLNMNNGSGKIWGFGSTTDYALIMLIAIPCHIVVTPWFRRSSVSWYPPTVRSDVRSERGDPDAGFVINSVVSLFPITDIHVLQDMDAIPLQQNMKVYLSFRMACI